MSVILGLSLMPTQMDPKKYETIHNFLIAFLLIVIWMFNNNVFENLTYFIRKLEKTKAKIIMNPKITSTRKKILMCLNFIHH
jgi:hypothetical protein